MRPESIIASDSLSSQSLLIAFGEFVHLRPSTHAFFDTDFKSLLGRYTHHSLIVQDIGNWMGEPSVCDCIRLRLWTTILLFPVSVIIAGLVEKRRC